MVCLMTLLSSAGLHDENKTEMSIKEINRQKCLVFMSMNIGFVKESTGIYPNAKIRKKYNIRWLGLIFFGNLAQNSSFIRLSL